MSLERILDIVVPGFTVMNRLGGGGSASYFRIRDSLGQDLAIKIVSETPLIDSSNMLSHFAILRENYGSLIANEAAVGARVFGKHLAEYKLALDGVTVREADTTYKTTGLIFEYIEGKTLTEYVADRIEAGKPLKKKEMHRLFRQIVLGIDELHQSGILHRDIKPDNIMVTPAGDIKVIDYGIAGNVQGLFGDRLYQAPEVYGGKYTAQSDLFSLGCVFYFMKYGSSPLQWISDDKHDFADFFKSYTREWDVATSGGVDVSGISRLSYFYFGGIINLIRYNPEKRFSSTEKLLNSLPKEKKKRRGLDAGDILYIMAFLAPVFLRGDTDIHITPTYSTLPDIPAISRDISE